MQDPENYQDPIIDENQPLTTSTEPGDTSIRLSGRISLSVKPPGCSIMTGSALEFDLRAPPELFEQASPDEIYEFIAAQVLCDKGVIPAAAKQIIAKAQLLHKQGLL
jgi:hypothetical protein